MGVKENLELMKTLDDAWNAGPDSPLWEVFRKRHREDVKVNCLMIFEFLDLGRIHGRMMVSFE